jgi:hypothetical protein
MLSEDVPARDLPAKGLRECRLLRGFGACLRGLERRGWEGLIRRGSKGGEGGIGRGRTGRR